MTRMTHARIAGFTFLAYIAAGITSLVLFRRATSGEGIAAKFETIAAHTSDIDVLVLLGLAQVFSAIVLGVTLYAITRVEDNDLAVFGLVCRVGEGIIAAMSIPVTLTLFWLATASGTEVLDTAAAQALGSYLLRDGVTVPATFFAVGSAVFSYLFLRGRMIPVALAWLGVAASLLLVIGLPLRLAGWLHEPVTTLMWLPMLAFEVPLGLWLLIKGVPRPASEPQSIAFIS